MISENILRTTSFGQKNPFDYVTNKAIFDNVANDLKALIDEINAISGGDVTGSGTQNYISKWNNLAGDQIGDSLLFDNGVSVGIGTMLPSTSASFQIDSTTKGFLAPRMTTGQRNLIAAPATGLFIYNITTSLFNYWDGATWQDVDSGTSDVASVSGTANRITSTGGANPIIDIAATYVGQTSIITLGTITTGVWQGTAIANGFLANSSITVNGSLTSLGGTVTITTTGTANRISVTGGGGLTPTIDIAATYLGQTSITTLGIITTGAWNGTKIGEIYGGTNQSTYTIGDILYASALNVLSKLPIGTSGQQLTVLGGVPVWSSVVSTGFVALTDAATIAVDASLSNSFKVTLGGNRTLGNPTNPVDAQKIIIAVTQDGTGNRTLAYGSAYRFGDDIPDFFLSTVAAKTDYIGFVYNGTAAKWDAVSIIRGF